MMINIKQIKGLFKELQDLWTDIRAKANSKDLHKVASSGKYDDLENKPKIPVVPNISKAGLSGKYDDLEGKPEIPIVPNVSKAGLSGKYEDLENKPDIPTLPDLHKLAYSGKYDDLEDKPEIEIPTIDKTTLGLDKVNNTRDTEKPVSEATQKELDKKSDNTFILLKQSKEQFANSTTETAKVLFDTATSVKGNISMSGNGILIQEDGVYQIFSSIYKGTYGPGWRGYNNQIRLKIYKNGIFLTNCIYMYRLLSTGGGPTAYYDIVRDPPDYLNFLELSKNDLIEIFVDVEIYNKSYSLFDRAKTFLFAKKIS